MAVGTIATPATGWADELDTAPAQVCPDQVLDSQTGECLDPVAKLASDLSSAVNLPPFDASTLPNLAGVPGLINPNVNVPLSVGLPGIPLPPIGLPQGGTPQMPQLPELPSVGLAALAALPAVGLPSLPGTPQLCGPKIDTPIPFVGFQPCI